MLYSMHVITWHNQTLEYPNSVDSNHNLVDSNSVAIKCVTKPSLYGVL